MADEYILSPTGVPGDRFALAKKVYAANVIRTWLSKVFVWSTIPSEDMMGGVSKDIIRWFTMSAQKKVDHALNPKQRIQKKVLTIRLEDDETVSLADISKKDMLIVHYDASGNIATSSTEALAQKYETQALCQGILAARTAADGVFVGGQQQLRAGSTTIATQYPDSIVGSRRLQDDIKGAHQLMFEDNVPQDLERNWYMKYREYKLLQHDPMLMSRDYVGEMYSDKIKGKLLMVDGAWIIPSNNYPQSDLTGVDDNTPTKNGVDAYLVNAADSVALCLTSESLRKAEPEPVNGVFYWLDDNRNWTIGAAGFKTIEIYRPEATAEIRVTA